MPIPMQGNPPPVGAPPGFVPPSSGGAPGSVPPPVPGLPGQLPPGMSPEQLQMEMQLIQLLMQNPAFAQAVTALRARRMAGPQAPGAAPQGGDGGAAPGGFADFVNQLQQKR